MLYRKIKDKISKFYDDNPKKVLIVDGARQVGKTFIIRQVGAEKFKNFIEINMLEDKLLRKEFANVRSVEDFYIRVSSIAGEKMQASNDTLIFIDEIQEYPELITLLKFLNDDGKYRFIASGSLLGIALSNITSIPIGTIEIMQMYPLDFEEFMMANAVGVDYIDFIKDKILKRESLEEVDHNRVLDLFKKYLLVGGMPDVINSYLARKNIQEVRTIQNTIINLYKTDCSKYDRASRLKIQRIYELIPSYMENKKKRVILKTIENKSGKVSADYQDEFDYLINSGIALEVKSISEPKFPLLQSTMKNLLKLYMNDVGLLTCLLYGNNISPIIENIESINLGSVYETVIATELKAHGKTLYYFDSKKQGEVDFLVDDYNNLSVVPIEVKSGKNYYTHTAMTNLSEIKNYNIKSGYVLSNSKIVSTSEPITYLPIYAIICL